jgi:hypothetical protein
MARQHPCGEAHKYQRVSVSVPARYNEGAAARRLGRGLGGKAPHRQPGLGRAVYGDVLPQHLCAGQVRVAACIAAVVLPLYCVCVCVCAASCHTATALSPSPDTAMPVGRLVASPPGRRAAPHASRRTAHRVGRCGGACVQHGGMGAVRRHGGGVVRHRRQGGSHTEGSVSRCARPYTVAVTACCLQRCSLEFIDASDTEAKEIRLASRRCQNNINNTKVTDRQGVRREEKRRDAKTRRREER